MRFVLLSQYYPPEMGAPQVRLPALVRELIARGHEVEVVTAVPNHPAGRVWPGWRGRLYVRQIIGGAVVHRTWLPAGSGAGLRRMLGYAGFGLTSLLGLLRCRRPDYLLLELPPLTLGPGALLASLMWRARLVPLVADLWPDAAILLGLLKPGVLVTGLGMIERLLYKHSHAVSAVTDGIARELISAKNVPPARVLPLPNGVDIQVWRPHAPDPKLARTLSKGGLPILLYAGTMGYAHGLEVVLDAAALLRGEAAFALMGGGSELPRLKALAAEMDLSNLRFLEPVPPQQAARLYGCCLAGLCTVRQGLLAAMTRPAKLPAIMACAKPVLYSGLGEGADLVQGAGAGVVTPPGDAQALAQAIRGLIKNPTQAEALGRAGRAFVQEHLAWPQVAGRWLDALEALP